MNIPPYGPSLPEWQRQVASQLNAFFQRLADLPEYADNAAAVAAGLNQGDFYRNGSQVMVCLG